MALPDRGGGAVVLMRRHNEIVERLRLAGWSPLLGAPSFPSPDLDGHVAGHLLRAVVPAGDGGGHPGHPGHLPGCDIPLIEVEPNGRARPYAVIHAGSGSPRKNWPVERFAEVAECLDRAGLETLVLAGPADAYTSLGGRATVRELGLREVAALLAGASLFVGNDSGISHVGGAVGAPTVAVFGPTRARRWRPLGPRVAVVEPAHRCALCRAADDVPAACDCLRTVGVDDVLAAAAKITSLPL